MTNSYKIVDGPDGEPTVSNKLISIRGYYADKIKEIILEEGWEAGAAKVCDWCGGYIEDEDEDADFTRHICNCDDPTPSNPQAPI